MIHNRIRSNNINRDSGIEIPEAWMPTIKKDDIETYESGPPREQYIEIARIETHERTNQSQRNILLKG